MLSLATNMRVYLCRTATDMRKSFDGLVCMTRQVFELDPVDGHLFLFFNRRRDRVKVLWWDRDGLALFCKRLEAGSYEVPACTEDRAGVEIDATQLSLLLNGIETTSVKRRKRYVPSK